MKRVSPTSNQPLPCVCNDECRQAGSPSCRSWGDVESSLLKMDSLYGASFTTWLKNEENVTVTATYLQRVCNEYCFPRILAAIRWLEAGWKPDSTAWLLRHITQHWGTGNRCSSDKVDIARATFVQCLMESWPKVKCAEFVPAFLDLAYTSLARRLVFLRTLFEKFDFARLSELFSLMGSGLDYSSKVLLLQEAARRDCLKSNNKRRKITTAPAALSSPKRSKLTRLDSETSSFSFMYPTEPVGTTDSELLLDTVVQASSDSDYSVITHPTTSPPSSGPLSRRPSRLLRNNTQDNYSLVNTSPTTTLECSNSTYPSCNSIDSSSTEHDFETSFQETPRSSRTCPGSPSLSQSFLPPTYSFSPAPTTPTHRFFPEESTSQDHSTTKVTSLF